MKKCKAWNWWKIGAWTLASALVCGSVVYYNAIYKQGGVDGSGPAKVGDICPDFTVDYVYGAQGDTMVIDETASFTLSEQKGKVVVINFWASYCDPCIKEIGHFNELQESYEESVEVVILNGEMTETAQSVLDNYVNASSVNYNKEYYNKYYEEYFKKWPTYTCTFARYEDDNNIIKKFDVAPRWPVTIVVDREGVIRYMAAASLTYEGLEQVVVPLL